MGAMEGSVVHGAGGPLLNSARGIRDMLPRLTPNARGYYTQVATEDAPILGGPDAGDAGSPTMRARLESTVFQMLIAAVIVANAAVIGLETDHPSFWMWPLLEDTFLVIFAAELSVRVLVYGLAEYFWPGNPDVVWNAFDFFIVSVGVVDRLFALVFAGSGGDARFAAMLMRLFRLLRILRIFRIFRVLKQLWLLMAGFLEALAAVLWVSLLCGLFLYICAIMSARLVGRPVDEDPDSVNLLRVTHFGSVSAAMLTLFELMSFPDLERYRPIFEGDPLLQLCLVAFVIFGTFTIVSLITGVISESMITKSRAVSKDRRAEQERFQRQVVEEACAALLEGDEGCCGVLTRERFAACKPRVLEICSDGGVAVGGEDLDLMFDLVDYARSGKIEIRELLYGMVQLVSEVRPMAILELRSLVVRGIGGVNERIDELRGDMSSIDGHLRELLALRARDPPQDFAAAKPVLLMAPSPIMPADREIIKRA